MNKMSVALSHETGNTCRRHIFNEKKKGFLLSEEYDIMVINIFNNILEQFIRYVKEEYYLRDPADIFLY